MEMPYKDLESLRSCSLQEYVSYLREKKLHACYGPEVVEIHFLMAALDTFRCLEWDDESYFRDYSWKPKSEQVRECINRLTAAENRIALRTWYRPLTGKMNSTADWLRRYLSNIIGEDL